mmetsp:Transcript_14628/g.42933  ORF Transcript_14628/g.42933 Transcript_14628/m.42933 type:complete len:267 (-) Transcript_14628:185-985(-)
MSVILESNPAFGLPALLLGHAYRHKVLGRTLARRAELVCHELVPVLDHGAPKLVLKPRVEAPEVVVLLLQLLGIVPRHHLQPDDHRVHDHERKKKAEEQLSLESDSAPVHPDASAREQLVEPVDSAHAKAVPLETNAARAHLTLASRPRPALNGLNGIGVPRRRQHGHVAIVHPRLRLQVHARPLERGPRTALPARAVFALLLLSVRGERPVPVPSPLGLLGAHSAEHPHKVDPTLCQGSCQADGGESLVVIAHEARIVQDRGKQP